MSTSAPPGRPDPADAGRPGLVVLQGHRLETLAEAVFAWLERHPLAPLEAETFLVPSLGMGEWLKIALARRQGICAATRVELPARFFWRAWRAVLGRAAVPAALPLDELPLAWRLMQGLPGWAAADPVFAPVAGFLGEPGDALRRWALARRLADLFDQYQVYRPDWLDDWAAGHDRLGRTPVPEAQRWQPALWRALRAGLPASAQDTTRGRLQQRFVQALQRGGPHAGLPRRVVLFGTTHLPQTALQALVALGRQVQVLLAVPDPCRGHWVDLADRHPLLGAWGRQARDFVRALDAIDGVDLRIELHDEAPPGTLLARVQAAVRELQAPAEMDRSPPAAGDRSIVFHVAHGPMREVEVLHDQLLQLLARPPGGRPLAPRDIVVMVPDVEAFAPAIRAVFGQHARGTPRHVPWGIADRQDRGRAPLLVALEWVLGLPQRRAGASELLGLLEVPALARRFGLDEADRPRLAAWVQQAGIRWGLDAAQREALGLAAAGEANTWAFGLRRMLLGFAAGDGVPCGEIEPCAELVGLEAAPAGALAALLHLLGEWSRAAARPLPPAAWAGRLRALLADLFEPVDDAERALLAALDQALTDGLQATEAAGFDAELPLAVAREAWLGALQPPGGGQRFRAGGVTFCTLLPLRAIPFEVVCLLGMNDGDYPRRAPRSDLDLMALPGQARPGDRSRRDDDRQLMLDALLSARRVLYLSWAGRSVRDPQPQPPSVLVGQLRDHLASVWGRPLVDALTTEHPLQPFSRRYFEPGGPLFTYAGEWRAAHEAPPAPAPAVAPPTAGPRQLTLADLEAFVRNPVRAWFRHRLQVHFAPLEAAAEDDEPFGDDALERWGLGDAVLRAAQQADGEAGARVAAALAPLRRAGRLPLAGPGRLAEARWAAEWEPPVAAWQAAVAGRTRRAPLPLRLAVPGGPVMDDALAGLLEPGDPSWVVLQASRLAPGRPGSAPRGDKLVGAWLWALACAAAGQPGTGRVIGPGLQLHVPAAEPGAARAQLLDLLAACGEALAAPEPWPAAVRTGLAWLAGGDPAAAEAYDGGERQPGEGQDACLARAFPGFEALRGAAGFEAAVQRLHAPLAAWLAGLTRVEPGHD